jgi:two-component system, OmpR family, osmolarity sensor histidine kinase EnvZ
LLAAHEDRRLALLSELSGSEGVRIYAADLLEEIEPLPNDPMLRLIAQKIVRQLGSETLVAINHFGVPGLWVSFTIGQDDYWVVIPRIQVERHFPWEWLGWGALIIMLSLAGAYFIALRINMPLKMLVLAADRIRRGEQALILPEDGTDEFREVSRTFNQMSESLNQLDAERTLLLAGISHDLRTPLARLRLSVEMLSDEQAGGLKEGMVQDISDMNGIIHQFLDFVRGVEGEPTQMVDLNGLLKSLFDRYTRAGRKLVLNLAPTHLVPLRPLAMQRLLSNLIDNAYAYGSKDGVTITTSIKAETIELSVLDTGPGIPPAQIARLLRPFERLDTARGNKSGSGLGLAIADRIAKLHKGRLEINNRPTGGLEVKLILPIMPS